MDCLIPRPDIKDTWDELKQEISARVLNGAPVIPLSDEDILSGVFSGALWEVGGIADVILRETNPATMCCDNLIKYASRRGIHLQNSTRASGFIRLTGDAGSGIPSNLRFVLNSIEYELNQTYNNPLMINGSGFANLQIIAVNGGKSGNVGAGSTLTLTSTVAGLDSAVLTTSAVHGGLEEEDCEILRGRILSLEKRGGIVGNMAWLEAETFNYAGVTKVCAGVDCCNDNWITIYPFMEGTFPPYGVPDAAVLQQMTNWMFGNPVGSGKGKAPIGLAGVYMCATPCPVNIFIKGLSVNSDTLEAIKASIIKNLRNNVCVGGIFCKKIVEQAIFQAIPSACYERVIYDLTCADATQDDKNIYLRDGNFPVLGSLIINL